MGNEPDNWINRWGDKFEAKADRWLHHLERRCPKCGGELHRKYTFLDKLGLYFPLPHTIYARHLCDKCGAMFRSYCGLTDLFLEAGWLSALFILGEWWAFALAGTLTWLIISSSIRGRQPNGSMDSISAGVILGIVLALALVFGDDARGQFLMNHFILFFFVLLFLVLAPVCVVLILDRYTYFQLKPLEHSEKEVN
jgi:hypothetical protein